MRLYKRVLRQKTSGAVKELRDAMLANIVRMLFCVVVGFAVLALQGEVSRLRVDSNTLLRGFMARRGEKGRLYDDRCFFIAWVNIPNSGKHRFVW